MSLGKFAAFPAVSVLAAALLISTGPAFADESRPNTVLFEDSPLPVGSVIEVDSAELPKASAFPIYAGNSVVKPSTVFVKGVRVISVPGATPEEVAQLNLRGPLFIAQTIFAAARTQPVAARITVTVTQATPVFHSDDFTATNTGRIVDTSPMDSSDFAAWADLIPRTTDSIRTMTTPPRICESCLVAMSIARETGLSEKALKAALDSYQHNLAAGKIQNRKYLTVVDYTLPSSAKRGILINMVTGKVEKQFLVSHGLGSGRGAYATDFSNKVGSNETSIGAFITASAPHLSKVAGFALSLEGEDKTNNNALARGILIHSGKNYVSESLAKSTGRIGNTQGCFALSKDYYRQFIREVQGRSLLYAYGEAHPKQPPVRTLARQ